MNIKEQLKIDEGLRLKPYKCTAGKSTIGYGRNLDDKGISQEEAEMMLENDIVECKSQLLKNLPFYPRLSEDIKNVLINLCFNMGIKKLLEFKNTLRLIEESKYKEAAQALRQSLYYKQVTKRAERLCKVLEGVNGT